MPTSIRFPGPLVPDSLGPLPRLGLALLAALLILPSAPVAAQEGSVTWLVTPFPPVNILEGPLKGQGLNDGMRRRFQEEMPDLEHREMSGNLARLLAMARQGETVCSVNLLKTPEREVDLVYSRPATVSLTLHLVLRHSTWTAMGSPTELSVDELAGRGTLDGAVEIGRAYSPEIDRAIEAHDSLRRMPNEGRQLFRMLLGNRIGYTIEYPFVVSFLAEDAGDDWIVVPIAEAPPYVVGHVACSRTDLGREVIARIDQALDRLRTTPDYLELITRWHPPAAAERVVEHFTTEIEKLATD